MSYHEDKIEGRNPVLEALKAQRDIEKLLVSGSEGSVKKIVALARQRRIPVQQVPRQKLDELCPGGNHQGVVALAAVQQYATVDDILQRARDRGEAPFIIVLDELSDPHNLGAILRTANGAGAHGVIIPKHRSVGLSGTVAKAAAGAVEYTPVARVTNLTRTIQQLKEQGVWFYATHQDGEQRYDQADFSGGVGLVIGSEGFGVSRLVAESCDFFINIPMAGEINSLNASVAAGVLMYEVVRQRRKG